MKKTIQFAFIFILLFCVANAAMAQSLGGFKPTASKSKMNKLTNGSKRLYIASFQVNFEIYKEAVDKKSAGGFGRTVTNAAKAKAAVGLATLDKAAIQEKTDKLYSEFVTAFAQKGYEIIDAEEAKKTDTYSGKAWEKHSGPSVFETDMTGIIAAIPSNYIYYSKERNALSSKLAGFDKTPQNLSRDLDDALVADVSLIYVFAETGQDFLDVGNAAKVKLFINYRLDNNYVVTDEKTNLGITSMFDKSKQAVALSSYVNFTRGKLPIGGSAEAQYLGSIKYPLEILDVMAKEKIVAYSKKTSVTATLLNPVVSIRGDNYSETTKWLEPDAKKYADGMYDAGKMFLMHHINEVFGDN